MVISMESGFHPVLGRTAKVQIQTKEDVLLLDQLSSLDNGVVVRIDYHATGETYYVQISGNAERVGYEIELLKTMFSGGEEHGQRKM